MKARNNKQKEWENYKNCTRTKREKGQKEGREENNKKEEETSTKKKVNKK